MPMLSTALKSAVSAARSHADGLLARRASHPQVQALLDRVHGHFPAPARALLIEGLRRRIDHQDVAAARAYLDALQPFVALDSSPDAGLMQALARHLQLLR